MIGAWRLPIGAGGGSDPDPIVFCPANGFIPDPEIYVPPYPQPDSNLESIIFICNADVANWDCQTRLFKLAKTGTSDYKYEVFNMAGTLVDTFNSSAIYVNFNFPTNDTYYSVRISFATSGSTFTHFYNNSSVVLHNSSIEAAIFNTPNLEGCNFAGNLNFRSITFNSDLLAFVSFLSFVESCVNFEYFKFKTSYPALSGFYSVFKNSGIKKIDLRGVSVPNINLADNIASYCKYLDEIHFPEVFTATRFNDALANTIRLRKITMYTSAPNMGTGDANCYLRAFQYSAFEGEIVIPACPLAGNIQSMFEKCANVTKITMLGDWSGVTIFTYGMIGCTSLVTVEMPRLMKATVAVNTPLDTTNVALKYYIGPDVGYGGIPSNAGLISITGDHDTSGFTLAGQPYIIIPYTAKATFSTINMPLCRVSKFEMGPNANYVFSLVTAVNIDWANSGYANTTAPQIKIGANLDATELDRILTLLPVMSGKIADIGNCTGYQTCDHTIAIAKGWGIRGWVKMTTNVVTDIAQTTATSGSTATYDGGYTPSQRGVCWALSPTIPTTSNAKTSQGAGDASFVSSITALTANRTYNVRAYCTTTYGTSYGQVESFTTLP